MRTTALLLLLAALLGVGAWWLLGERDPIEEPDEEDPFAEPAAERVEPPPPSSGPPEMVVLPADTAPTGVAVLAAGEDVPEAEPDPSALERLHEARIEGDPRRLDGADLLRQVGRRVPVRAVKEADLRALEELAPDVDWPPEGDVPLVEVVEHWRRAGFEVELRGTILRVARPDE